jgi:hypothetical protein
MLFMRAKLTVLETIRVKIGLQKQLWQLEEKILCLKGCLFYVVEGSLKTT